ncbi:energy transducer TonB [Hymenobacter mucosus]|uniref:TonB protein C-terminal n=1 Tax=Hymenobacter mucosus TaxID=1411120 RepID=A0A238X0R6_9BACT|nr:hypothetical protein [Hymenobacter mucosus]SNR52233.1 hypothetical protein SAMN06269173_103332 [Hymenobacter mucosus]
MPFLLAKPLSLSLGLFFTSLAATAQSSPTPVPMPNAVSVNQNGPNKLDGRTFYTYVEKMPVYSNGGREGLQAFISSHVRGAAGGSDAYISFIIDQDGNVRRPALGPNPAETEAAVDPALATAFASIESFTPGYQNGKPVDVKLTLPIAKPVKK